MDFIPAEKLMQLEKPLPLQNAIRLTQLIADTLNYT